MKKYLYILCGLMCLQSALAFDATVFPTLAGLSRTVKYEFSSDGCAGTSPQTQTIQPNKEVTINGKQYLEFTGNIYLREADNKVYVYSGQGTEDLVLYDYALGVGEMLKGIKMQETPDGRIFSHSEETALTVTKIEPITLLDGKEYKKWTFNNGMEYVETIGMYGEDAWAGDFFLLIQQPISVCQIGNHLVCVSCNGQLLYEMPQEKQEQLHTYCMSSPKIIQANQWNVLEIQAYIDRLVISEFTLSSDTIINNVTYTKVMQRATLTSDAPTYAAAIRQEDDKVFVCYDSKEYLLYDFGAKAGDEILVWGGLDHPTTLCKNIVKDVQTTADGKRVLSVEIKHNTETELKDEAQWIEGIGSTHGLLYTGVTYTGGPFHYLQCAYTNGTQVYERTGDTFAEYGCEYNSDHTYFPEGKVWSYRITPLCTEGEVEAYIQQTKVSGAKTINGKQYVLINDNTPIREDGKQVFAYDDDNDKDVLIYDFSLEVGDKITSYDMGGFPEESTVTAVDYITLLDGRKAKRIQYDYRATDIEYVGSTSNVGILAPLYGYVLDPCGPIDFLCCSYNGQPLYETSAGSCDNIDTRLDNTSAAPQAVKYLRNGQLFLQLGEQSYDVLGRPVSLLNE